MLSRRTLRRCPWLLLVALCACGGGERRTGSETGSDTDPAAAPPAAPDPAPDPARDVELTCDMLPDGLLHVTPTRAELRGRYGEPDSMKVAVEPNRHIEGAIDSLFTVHYNGLQVTIRTPPSGRDLAETVDIRDNRYLRYPEVGIGTPAATILDVLGRPRETDGDRLVYDCADGAEQPTTFWLADARVTRILIEYYVD